eukprot:1166394-Pyramimonas_sp.AAC.1
MSGPEGARGIAWKRSNRLHRDSVMDSRTQSALRRTARRSTSSSRSSRQRSYMRGKASDRRHTRYIAAWFSRVTERNWTGSPISSACASTKD